MLRWEDQNMQQDSDRPWVTGPPPPPQRNENTTGRALWVVWCCWWAGFWLVAAALGNLGHLGLALTELALSAGSGAAIAIPVGKRWPR